MRVVAIPDKRLTAEHNFSAFADEILDSFLDFDPSKYDLPPFNSK